MKRVELFGPVASGKTTLLKGLTARCESKPFAFAWEDLTSLEQQRQSWRDDQKAKSFFMQSVYYRHRYEHLQKAVQSSHALLLTSDYGLVADHHVYSTFLYEAGSLSELEFAELAKQKEVFEGLLPPLAGLIYTRSDADTISKRLIARGGGQIIPHNWLSQLVGCCEKALPNLGAPVLTIQSPDPTRISKSVLSQAELFLNSLL